MKSFYTTWWPVSLAIASKSSKSESLPKLSSSESSSSSDDRLFYFTIALLFFVAVVP